MEFFYITRWVWFGLSMALILAIRFLSGWVLEKLHSGASHSEIEKACVRIFFMKVALGFFAILSIISLFAMKSHKDLQTLPLGDVPSLMR